MAARVAVATGNWSNPATWDGGVSVPGAGDTADSNGFTVTIDVASITVTELKNTHASAGLFALSRAGTTTINANISAIPGRPTLVTSMVNNSDHAVINGNITGHAGGAAGSAVYHTSFGNLTVNGNVTGGGANGYGLGVQGAAAAVVTINGNVTAGPAGSARGAWGDRNNAWIISGSVTGGGGTSSVGLFATGGATNITIGGSVVGGSASDAVGVHVVNGTLTCNGPVTGGTYATAYGVSRTGNGVTYTNSTVTGSANAHAINQSANGGAVIASGAPITGGSAANVCGVMNVGGGAVHTSHNVVGGGASGAYGVHNSTIGLVTVRGSLVDGTAVAVYQAGGAVTYNSIVYAVATGNWSAGATWSTGSPPGPSNQVDSNGFTVTIDQDVTVAGLFGSSPSGGVFGVSASRVITADIQATVRDCVADSAGVGATVTTVGTVRGGVISNMDGILKSGAGSHIHTGNIVGGAPISAYGMLNLGSGGITVNGNVVGGSGGVGLWTSSVATISVVGDVVGGGVVGLHNNTTATINVTGNATGGTATGACGVNNAGAGTVTISGNATGGAGSLAYGARNGAGGSLSVAGAAVGNNYGAGGIATSAAGVYGSNTAGAITTVKSVQYGPYGQAPLDGAVKLLKDPANSAAFLCTDATTRTLVVASGGSGGRSLFPAAMG